MGHELLERLRIGLAALGVKERQNIAGFENTPCLAQLRSWEPLRVLLDPGRGVSGNPYSKSTTSAAQSSAGGHTILKGPKPEKHNVNIVFARTKNTLVELGEVELTLDGLDLFPSHTP